MLKSPKTFMQKFRAEIIKFEVKSVKPTKEEIPSNDTFLEEQTGDTIWSIIHAEDETKAREKAAKLAQHLKTGSLTE